MTNESKLVLFKILFSTIIAMFIATGIMSVLKINGVLGWSWWVVLSPVIFLYILSTIIGTSMILLFLFYLKMDPLIEEDMD